MTFLGLETHDVSSNNKGTYLPDTSEPISIPISTPYVHPEVIYDTIGPKMPWKLDLPSALDLYKQEFGKPDSSHSFTQEACGETIMHFILS